MHLIGRAIQAIQSGTRDAVNVTQESQQLVEAGSAQSSNNIQSLENKVTELETLLARFRLV